MKNSGMDHMCMNAVSIYSLAKKGDSWKIRIRAAKELVKLAKRKLNKLNKEKQ